MRSILAKVLFCVVLIAIGAHADHWGYLPEDDDGKVNGRESWGGKCDQGRHQSPVDLNEDASVLGHYPALTFGNYSEPIQAGSVRNTGHSIQIEVSPQNKKYTMSGAGLPGVYIMDQMHFHWASEHTIDHHRYALELHIVSHEQRFANFSEAVKHKNGVSVLGVLFYASDRHNAVLKNVLDSFEPVHDHVGESHALKEPLHPQTFLPKNLQRYYRYEGSLTTPTCDEAVMWTVLTDPVPLELSQIVRFKSTVDDSGSQLTHNYRTVQRLNSRPLIYVQGPLAGDSGSARTTLAVVLLVFSQLAVAIWWH